MRIFLSEFLKFFQSVFIKFFFAITSFYVYVHACLHLCMHACVSACMHVFVYIYTNDCRFLLKNPVSRPVSWTLPSSWTTVRFETYPVIVSNKSVVALFIYILIYHRHRRHQRWARTMSMMLTKTHTKILQKVQQVRLLATCYLTSHKGVYSAHLTMHKFEQNMMSLHVCQMVFWDLGKSVIHIILLRKIPIIVLTFVFASSDLVECFAVLATTFIQVMCDWCKTCHNKSRIFQSSHVLITVCGAEGDRTQG